MTLSFTVAGTPRPKQSFRYSRRGNYQPARVTTWQDTVALIARIATAEHDGYPLACDVAVELWFHLPNRRRVDLDNLSKAVLDALNGVTWRDDTQITDLHIHKDIDRDNPRVEVNICHQNGAV